MNFEILLPASLIFQAVVLLWLIIALSAASAASYFLFDTASGKQAPASRFETYSMSIFLALGPTVAYLAVLDAGY